MKKFIKEYGYGAFLGAALALLGYDLLTWQYWIVLIGTIGLVEWSRD